MLRRLAILIRVLLLNVLRVRDRYLGKIGGFLEFPNYFAPYIRGGTRAVISHTSGGGNIVIQQRVLYPWVIKNGLIFINVATRLFIAN